MSVFKSLKSLADDFKEMISDKDKEKKKDDKPLWAPTESTGGGDRNYTANGSQDQQHYNSGQQSYNQSYPAQHQYQPQQQHQQSPSQSQAYGGAPPGPNLPHGWIQQWDQNSQRYYYLEQATGRTHWEPPMNHDRGFGGPSAAGQNEHYRGGYQPGYGQGYGAPPGTMHPRNANYPVEAVKAGESKKSGNKGALLAAGAGGLALGGLAGAALADDSSDDEHHSGATAGYGTPPTAYGAPSTGYTTQPGYGAPPADDSQALEHNSDVSSSQRSSLEEARHEYEEAQRKAADSDASSSDHEEAEEAREEYEEEIEEARSDAED